MLGTSVCCKGSLKALVSTAYAPSVSKLLNLSSRCCSTSSEIPTVDLTTYKKESNASRYEKPAPYKNPGPRRYGYITSYKTQGVLPRNDKPVRSLPPYTPTNSWTNDKALFGQNDYIDILGDGDVHPADLLRGPKWLIAFKGNERDRLMRRMEWEGPRLKMYYPSEWNRLDKRIRYLTRLYNNKRKSRWYD